jgi:membrane protease YdiL (CAAX protease family)
MTTTPDTLRNLVVLIPVFVLAAAVNGFTEEIIFRAAPIATVYEVAGKSNAIWMAATLLGHAHYIGGIPSGIPGVLLTALLGWFFGKCSWTLEDSSGRGSFTLCKTSSHLLY